MIDLHDQKRNRRIRIVALIWVAILAVTWTLVYGKVPLPRWWAVARALKELALLSWMLGGAYGWGRLSLARWHTEPGKQPHVFWAFGLGFGVLWLATLAAAALHLLGPAWPWILLGGGWLSWLASVRRPVRIHAPAKPSLTVSEWFLLAVMATSLGYSLLAWALAPPLAWDEVSYHLPIPQTFIEAGGLVSIPTIVHSNWPSGMEMLNTLALLMGSENLPHLIVTAMTVLTALGLADLSRRWFNRSTAWLAAALYLSMPMVKYLAGVALIEGALGFFGFLAIWAGYEWLDSRSGRDLILAGLIGGLAASIKLTGAVIPIAVGTTGLVWLLLRNRGEPWRNVAQFAGYGLIALAVVAPWYLRSAINTGNPIWPFLYSLFGGLDWDALGDNIHTSWLHRPNLAPTLWNYVAGLWYLTVRWPQFGGMSMGAAIMVFAPLSLLFWHRKPWLLSYLIAVSTIVYTAWFLTTHQTRFLMGIVPVLALLAAYALIQLLDVWPTWLGALGRVAMILYFVMALPFVDKRQWARIVDRWPYVSGHESRDEFLLRQVDGYPAFQFANAHLPPDAGVLLAIWETRGFYLERPEIWANPISQRVIKWEQFENAEQLAGFLHTLGITHVFWNNDLVIEDIPNEEHTEWLLRTLLAEYGRILYDQNGFAIYELGTAPSD